MFAIWSSSYSVIINIHFYTKYEGAILFLKTIEDEPFEEKFCTIRYDQSDRDRAI